MKVEELQLGDWIINPAHNDKARIGGIYYDKELHCLVATDGRFPQEYFEPIPLTSDILKKNGFKIGYGEHYGNEGLIDEATKHYYVKVGRWGHEKNEAGHCEVWDVCIDQHSPIYVHELQHALRLCGLNKLANNFQV